MRQPYPCADASLIDAKVMDDMEWIQAFVLGVRQTRSGMDIKPGKACRS
jgi:valyl-tRNA synthetase